jgi:hypothetical protein
VIRLRGGGADRALRLGRRRFLVSLAQWIDTMTKSFMIAPASWLGLLGLVGAFHLGCVAAQAQQFSADLVRTAQAGAAAPSGKLRVFNTKVRIETPDFADGFFLIDGGSRAAYFARSGERVFMDARQSSRLTQLFVPVDLSDPCRQWQDMAKLAGATDRGDPWRCERVGQDSIDGRGVVVYRAISSPGRDILGWIDPNLKFPLRIQTEDGTIVDVKNIDEGPQAANLFEIPPGFRKFDPALLIQRIKHSDVWVEETPP